MKIPIIRLAILECDTPAPKTKDQYGSYTGLFTTLLQAGSSSAGIPPSSLKISGYDVVEKQEYPDLEAVDAILITGSSTLSLFSFAAPIQLSDSSYLSDSLLPYVSHIDPLRTILMLPGHSAFDTNHWTNRLVAFVQRVLAHPQVRIVGICFGHQIVGRALGAPVQRNEQGWEVSAMTVDLSAQGQKLFGRQTLVSVHVVLWSG